MPMPRRFSITPTSLWLAAAVLAAGCASSAPPRFHSLLGGSPATAPAPRAGLAARPVDLGPVGVPPAVDQPQWVVRLPDESLRMLEQERWVAPLRDEVRGAVLDGLQQRWAVVDTRAVPAPQGQAWRVRLDIVRFETVAGQGAWIDARWVTTPPGAQAVPLSCTATLREPASTDTMALAAAHRRAIGALADRIGASLQDGTCGVPAAR